jgi:hypothetical protein
VSSIALELLEKVEGFVDDRAGRKRREERREADGFDGRNGFLPSKSLVMHHVRPRLVRGSK